jgi:outer membrane protein OmpA-like peptidoglycan-associated protein
MQNNPEWKWAAAVAASLVSQRIDKSRLTPQGFGDSKPVADNTAEEGRAKNRRVELVRLTT